MTGVPYSAGVRESQWNPRSLRWNVIVPWVLIAVAVLTVITGRLPGEDLVGLAETTGPVLVFVIAMTIVAELASVAGVFSVVAERLAVWGRGRRALIPPCRDRPAVYSADQPGGGPGCSHLTSDSWPPRPRPSGIARCRVRRSHRGDRAGRHCEMGQRSERP